MPFSQIYQTIKMGVTSPAAPISWLIILAVTTLFQTQYSVDLLRR